MFRRHQRVLYLAAAICLTGTVFQMGGCLSGAASYVANYNPCGTILECDPITYRFIQSGYEGPGVDVDVDPFCTWPPYCSTPPGSRTSDPLEPA